MKPYLRKILLIGLLVPALAACSLGGDNRSAGKTTATPTSFVASAGSTREIVVDTQATPTVSQETPPTSQPVVSQNAPQSSTRIVPTSTASSKPGSISNTPTGNTVPLDNTPSGPPQDGSMTIPEVVNSVKPAVVQIIAQESGGGGGTGSGFIIDKESHIITNNHVIEGADRLTVVMTDNTVARANLIGRDPRTDVAVLQIPQRDLPTVPLGDATKLEVGETVVAIGSALGLPGGPTVTTGVVSALKRAEREPAGDPNDPNDDIPLYDLIQTDTAINPGNSGGPLLNLRGEVVGINTLGQRVSDSGVPVQGINFAVSIDTAKDVSAEIIRTGTVVYPYIGISGRFLYPETAVREGLPDIPGQYIAEEPESGTPAAAADLHRGDIIVAINGQKINDESTFIRLLRGYDPGDTITLTINRRGREMQKEVTLIERPRNL